MSLGKVHDIDIVAEACSVLCRVVISEDAEAFALTYGCLGDERHEVVRNATLELKPEKDTARRETLVRKTLDAVKARGLDDILLISSFSPEILEYIKQVDPSCKTAYLYPAGYVRAHLAFIPPYKLMKKLQCHAAHPHKLCIRGDFVKKAHEKGLEVNVWTIDESEDIRAMIEAGVDGIITDCPDRVRSILNEMNGFAE